MDEAAWVAVSWAVELLAFGNENGAVGCHGDALGLFEVAVTIAFAPEFRYEFPRCFVENLNRRVGGVRYKKISVFIESEIFHVFELAVTAASCADVHDMLELKLFRI